MTAIACPHPFPFRWHKTLAEPVEDYGDTPDVRLQISGNTLEGRRAKRLRKQTLALTDNRKKDFDHG